LKTKIKELEQQIIRLKNLVAETSEIKAGGRVALRDAGEGQRDGAPTTRRTSLVSEGQIGEAINLLRDLKGQPSGFQSAVIQLSGRLAQLTRQGQHGTLSVADSNLEWARVSKAVQELIHELPD
jgi:hypothetical protein